MDVEGLAAVTHKVFVYKGELVVLFVVQVYGRGADLVAERDARDVDVVLQLPLVCIHVEVVHAVDGVAVDAVHQLGKLLIDDVELTVVELHADDVVHVGLHGVGAFEVDQRAVLQEHVGEVLVQLAAVGKVNDGGLELTVEGGHGGALLTIDH